MSTILGFHKKPELKNYLLLYGFLLVYLPLSSAITTPLSFVACEDRAESNAFWEQMLPFS